VFRVYNSRFTSCCEGPWGAVRELLRPSWFTADDTSSAGAARTAAAAAVAAEEEEVGRSTDHNGSAHTASVRTYPSAAASKVLHRPSGALGFRMWDSGFRAEGTGYRTQGLGFKFSGSGFRD
jgi:hypothetical protein